MLRGVAWRCVALRGVALCCVACCVACCVVAWRGVVLCCDVLLCSALMDSNISVCIQVHLPPVSWVSVRVLWLQYKRVQLNTIHAKTFEAN